MTVGWASLVACVRSSQPVSRVSTCEPDRSSGDEAAWGCPKFVCSLGAIGSACLREGDACA